GNPDARRALALAALRRQRPDTALTAAGTALALAPGAAEAVATLGLVELLRGRAELADRLFRRAVAANPGLAEAQANRAALLARTGREAEAAEAAAIAADRKPLLPAPHHLLGTLRVRGGRLEEAAASFARALAGDPGHLDARLNLADTLRRLGRPAEAAAAARDGLALRPAEPGLLANLGAALQAQGRDSAALAAYGRALALAPGLAEVDNNMGLMHHAAGRPVAAAEHLRRAHAARPGDVRIAGNLTAALLDAGADAEAGRIAALTVQANPDSPEALDALAQVFVRLDRLDEAEAALRERLRRSPAGPGPWAQAGALLLRAGARARALPWLRQALRLTPAEAPGRGRVLALLGQALRDLPPALAEESLRTDLAAALEDPGTEKPHLVRAAALVLAGGPAMARLAAGDGNADAVAADLRAGTLDPLALDPLLATLLEAAVVTEPALERALTRLRRALLDAAGDADAAAALAGRWTNLACALAQQCFLNEYAFDEADAETEAADRLGGALARTDVGGGDGRAEALRIAVYACYRPLHRWAGAEHTAVRAAAADWGPAMARLVARQIAEPREEAALAAAMPRLTAIEDRVSLAVRAQYEESPHPRWRHAGLLDEPMPAPRALRALFPHLELEPAGWDAPAILIAGCGTGRESVWTANQFRGARVVAVDLSLASLAYAQRQTRRLGLEGIAYAQADLSRLGGLDRRFDIVQSVGVLHHTADPLGNWRVLAGLVRPGGLMKIGLYSETARRTIVEAHGFIAERGIPATPAGIRRFRQEVLALPEGHALRRLVQSVDFFSVSACRDLVFHVHEHRMTLPQIAGWIAELGLEFVGFQFDEPSTAGLYRRRFPEDPAMTRLDLWDRFEAEHPFAFGGLYQFWVRKP
ncbi:class I SAM-dependent methyltransferase, partial [Azospirillum oleiclasticum]